MSRFLVPCIVLLLIACQPTAQQGKKPPGPPKNYNQMMSDPKVKNLFTKNYCTYDNDEVVLFDKLIKLFVKGSPNTSMKDMIKCVNKYSEYKDKERDPIPEQKFLCGSPTNMYAWCKCFQEKKMYLFPFIVNCNLPIDFGNGTKFRFDPVKGAVVAKGP